MRKLDAQKDAPENCEDIRKRNWNINVKCFFKQVKPHELTNYIFNESDIETTRHQIALETGAIEKDNEMYGQIYDFSQARIPDYMHIKKGTNRYSKHNYEYYGIGYATSQGKIFLSSGHDPRHQYDGTTEVLWINDNYRDK